MGKFLGSGIRMASIPVTLQVQPFSPESGTPGNPGSPGGSNPGPGGPSAAGGGGAFGAAGLIGLLLLLGFGGGLLTAPSDQNTAAPPPASAITASEPTEVPPAMRVYLLPQ